MFELVLVPNFILNNFEFLVKFAQKGYFQSKTEKENNEFEFNIFELIQLSNFSLKRQFSFCKPNL